MTAAIHFLYQYQWLVGLHGTNRFLKKFTTHTQWSCHCCYRLFAHLAVGLKSSTRTRVQPTCTHSCKSFILVCVRACAGSNCTNKENLKQNVQNSDNNLRFHVVSHGVVVDNRTPQWMETKVQQTIMSWISRKKIAAMTRSPKPFCNKLCQNSWLTSADHLKDGLFKGICWSASSNLSLVFFRFGWSFFSSVCLLEMFFGILLIVLTPNFDHSRIAMGPFCGQLHGLTIAYQGVLLAVGCSSGVNSVAITILFGFKVSNFYVSGWTLDKKYHTYFHAPFLQQHLITLFSPIGLATLCMFSPFGCRALHFRLELDRRNKWWKSISIWKQTRWNNGLDGGLSRQKQQIVGPPVLPLNQM